MRRLDISDMFDLKKNAHDTSSDRTRQKKAAVEARPRSLLEAFECIVELAENSNLDSDFFDKAAVQIRYAARKLRLTPMQVALLAIFIDRSEDSRIMMSEIAGYVGCRTTRILRLAADIDVLERQHYVRASRSHNSVSYRVPAPAINALRANTPYVHIEQPVDDTQGFFDRFDRLMKEKDDDELAHDSLKQRTVEMLEEIRSSVFATGLRRHGLDADDTLLFVFMAHLYVENNDNNINFHDIDDLFDDDELPPHVKRSLRMRRSPLFDKKLIENVNEDGMARSDAFKLTEQAKEELLGELSLNRVGKSDNGLVKASELTAKTLIYNPAESAQVQELTSILAPERFAQVQERLRAKGMRPGFCCIFYGAPGTGKTETVYQLARLTGRSIMRVDVDKVKSCWVGESEKNVKMLFDRYRSICRNSDLAPILLFNEADAVLGVRMEGASRAVDKMENSLQNIILQEMESLDGIMIATTNLTTNLDKAFERRFLYKVRFDKPTCEARALIWQAMLPGLGDDDAATLARSFDLSGGEIENIARKHSVNAILTGCDDIDLDLLLAACRQERLTPGGGKRVGF